MKRIEQPLSKEQRKELEGIVSIPASIARGVLFIGFILLIGYLLQSLQRMIILSPPLWVVPTAAVSIWLYIQSGKWTGGRGIRRRIRTVS